MKAKDLMVPLQEYLKPEMTLKEAAAILRTAKRDEERHGVKGLPVLEGEKMVGFLSIGDILKAVFPPYLGMMGIESFTWNGMVEDRAKKAGEIKVGQIMTRRVISVDEDASLMECVADMMKYNVKRLPVMGKGGKVAGILYERDVFLAITRAMLGEDGGAA